MDETDTGTSPEALSAEAARHLAELRRAEARAQFETPSWIGPRRSPAGPSQIPAQSGPAHDDLEVPEPPPVSAHPIPESAHWAEKTRPRLVVGGILVLALVGLLAFLVLTITTRSAVAITGLAGCGLVAVIFRGALMGTGVTTVDLKGSIMRIRKGGALDIVNLADPVHLVELVGTPDQAAWRLRLEAVDGRTVELGPQQVDPVEVHRIVEYYRAIADRDKRDREHRFNR